MRVYARTALAMVSFVAVLSFSAAQAQAAMRASVFSNRNYTNGICHQKIDPKGLKGPALKSAWKACRESPDSYN